MSFFTAEDAEENLTEDTVKQSLFFWFETRTEAFDLLAVLYPLRPLR